MDLTWSLDDLYTSIDSREFKDDLKAFEEELKRIDEWLEENLSDTSNITKKLEEFVLLKNRLGKYENLFLYTDLSLAADTENFKVMKCIDKLDDMNVFVTNQNVIFKRFLKLIDKLDEIMEGSNILLEHKFVLNELKRDSNYMLSTEEELVISRMKNTGSNLWKKMWEQLTSTLTADIEIDGVKETKTLSEIRNLAHEYDGSLRKNAYECELKAYEKIDKALAFALNGIKGEVIVTSKMRGYTSPLEMTLLDSRMDRATLDVMFAAIKDALPYFHKYFDKKSKLLGNKDGLPFYDLFAPIGRLDIDYNDAKDFIINSFRSFSEKMGRFAENAFDSRWIDFLPREGKIGGAFCENLHELKQSRVLLNFGDSFESVITIAHELGHAYHNSCLHGQTHLNNFCTMPIAETASTFSECILINYALKNGAANQRSTILEMDIQNMAQIIVDIYSRFLFEDELFRERENGSLSVEELKELFLDAQKEAYGSALSCLHPYMWACKPHYYDSEYNYYNFPYAYGLLFSRGLYSIYLDKGDEFVPIYDDMLKVSGKNNLYDIAKVCGIDIHERSFWDKSLNLIKDEIDMLYSQA